MSSVAKSAVGPWLPIIAVVVFALCVILVVIVRSFTFADCSWYGTVISYVDVNGNAHFDSDDSFLPGVPVHVDDIYNHYMDMSPVVTDQHGIGHLALFIAGCPTVDLQVAADAPPGFEPTSPNPVHVKKDFFGTLETGETYYFGFAKIP